MLPVNFMTQGAFYWQWSIITRTPKCLCRLFNPTMRYITTFCIMFSPGRGVGVLHFILFVVFRGSPATNYWTNQMFTRATEFCEGEIKGKVGEVAIVFACHPLDKSWNINLILGKKSFFKM